VPTSWWRLIKQRRRWEWAVITFECRKHIDMGNPLSPNFRFSNLLMLADRWIFNVFLTFLFWGWLAWCALHPRADMPMQFLTYYLVYVALDLLTLAAILYYSLDRTRDLLIGLAVPLMPLYQLMLRGVSLWAIVEEIFQHASFGDTYVPEHVRNATWHW
jgi:hypothetical protein